MPRSKHPDCVIDGRTNPALMRCNHCQATEPVQLPMEVNALVARSKEFEKEHAFCHMSLLALRSRLDVLNDKEYRSLSHQRRAAAERRSLHTAIALRENQNREKRDRKP